MNKQSNGGPVGPQKQNVTRSDLRRHSLTLYRALRALQRKHPSLTSEQFWKAIQDYWTRDDLNRAAISYAKTNRPTAFTKLIAKASEVLPQAGPDGFFEADGERWGMVIPLSRRLELSISEISSRLSCFRSREGRCYGSYRTLTFYALRDVKKVCADLLKAIPQAGPDGFFDADGEKWGSKKALARKLGHHKKTIFKRIDGTCRSRKGKNVHGYRCTFYALLDIQRVCADVGAKSKEEERRKPARRFESEALNIKALASKSIGNPSFVSKGFFKANRQVWGTVKVFRRELKLSRTTIIRRIDKTCRTRQGRNARNRPCTFYALSDILRVCDDVREFSWKRGHPPRKNIHLKKK